MNGSARTLISVDVTDWPDDARDQVIHALDAIAAKALKPLPAKPADASPWTEAVLVEGLLRLTASGAKAQVKAIKRAMDNLGQVTRAEVYEVAGYDPKTRSLKGFTRPCNRVTKSLKDDGLLPQDAPELLVPVYDDNVRGYQQAKAFNVPAGLSWN